MDREALIEAACGAFREREANGRVAPSPAWYDLAPADRALAFEEALRARRLEAAADREGLSTTARAVLARIRWRREAWHSEPRPILAPGSRGATMATTMGRGLTFRTLDGGSTEVDGDAVDALRSELRGPLLTEGDPGYDEARQLWNAMIDRRPGAIARCAVDDDVVAAIRFAARHRLLVTTRAGGHNIAGLGVCAGGLVIDLSGMRDVRVDEERRVCVAQGGCTIADVDAATQRHGLAAPLGFVSTTGIGGLTVGGGFGYLSRRFGWTCDSVEAFDVVLADGRRVRATASSEPELFWALRGGGGNFGVVTSFAYALQPVGPEILGGAIAWRGQDAPAVLAFLRDLAAGAPRELTTVAALRFAPPAPWLPAEVHGQPIVAAFVCWSGDPAEGERVLAPLRAFGSPVADIVAPRPYVQMQQLLDATQPPGRRYYWKSDYLPGLEPGLLDAVVAGAAHMPSKLSAILLFQLGGAIGDRPAGESPVGNRDAAWILNVAGSWEHTADDGPNVAWTRETWQSARPFSTGGVYVNFLTDEEGGDRIEAAYGQDALARLAAAKRRYDPDDLFRHTKRVAG